MNATLAYGFSSMAKKQVRHTLVNDNLVLLSVKMNEEKSLGFKKNR
jgi:hypothetical protein